MTDSDEGGRSCEVIGIPTRSREVTLELSEWYIDLLGVFSLAKAELLMSRLDGETMNDENDGLVLVNERWRCT